MFERTDIVILHKINLPDILAQIPNLHVGEAQRTSRTQKQFWFDFLLAVLVLLGQTIEGCNQQSVLACIMRFGMPDQQGTYTCK